MNQAVSPAASEGSLRLGKVWAWRDCSGSRAEGGSCGQALKLFSRRRPQQCSAKS